MRRGDMVLEFLGSVNKVIRERKAATLATERKREFAGLLIGFTARNTGPTGDHCLLDRHSPVKVGHKLLRSCCRNISKCRSLQTAHFLDYLSFKFYQGRNLDERALSIIPKDVTRLSKHRDTLNFFQQRYRRGCIRPIFWCGHRIVAVVLFAWDVRLIGEIYEIQPAIQ